MDKTKPFDISKKVVYDAYLRVKANQGAAGVDGQSVEDLEKDLKRNLYKIWNRMSSGTYFPPPVRSVEIPKNDGKSGIRKLGVPTVSDRIAQTVVKLYLEPEVEPLFHPDSYGYRPNKSALDAVAKARERCWRNDWVLELDIVAFFDRLDHKLVMDAVKKHTSCKWILLYIEREFQVRFCEGLGVKFPRSTHLVITAKSKEQIEKVKPSLESWLAERGLELHPEKTRLVKASDGFNFLGYTIRTYRDKCLPIPQKEKVLKLLQKLRDWLKENKPASPENVIRHFNSILRGWCNYYKPGVSKRVFSYVHHQVWKNALEMVPAPAPE